MKRTLHVLLVVLMITSTIGTAEASSKRKSKKKETTKEQTLRAQRGEAVPAPNVKREKKQADPEGGTVVAKPGPIPFGPPVELQLKRADRRKFDLRSLPRTPPVQQERAELPEPAFHPVTVQATIAPPTPSFPGLPTLAAPAPAPINVFEGLDRFNWGAGSPPDTNGDAGPNDYIQTVNTSIGVYRKSDGFQEAAFTFNTFMSQGHFGNLCDTSNFGDPVVVYDTFEDRWIITDFAFLTDISGNVVAPSFQCFAASMTGDPVSGGWNFYSIQITDALDDYPKFGIWPDGLYMSANMFTFGAGSTFTTARAWAFNKAQMYAGSPTVKVVSFDIPGGDFTVIPSNARLQTGTPPADRPNLFISTELFLNALTVYKFHVDWNSIALSTFTGPDVPIAATSWPNANVANAAQPGTGTLLDVLQIRAMVQNQYTNFGGTESLWVPHTVRRGNKSGFAAPRWYQVNVTGGTVNANLPQATTWDPDGANVINRFMPSLALDRAGNMAMGYSTSSGTVFSSIMYAGRLAADPVNTFSKTEQTFFTGTASQTGTTRWGDYSAMTLDPDGCTFWYTNEYANPADQTFNHRWLTKFGSFRFTECTPVGAGGTVSGTVTATAGGAPISGATVQLGARATTTNGSGNYSFTSIPAGTYPSMTTSKPGFVPGSASAIVVTDGGTTTQNFSLAAAPSNACLTDTTQADFLTGVPTNVDLNSSPGDVQLVSPDNLDQQNTTIGNNGVGISTTTYGGQTFTAALTGKLTKADINLSCFSCSGTPPTLTLSVRAASGGLPTGPDLATATVPGFNNDVAVFYTVTFSSPLSVIAGTQYALVIHPDATPTGTYALSRSGSVTVGSDVYAGGTCVSGATSGTVWSIPTTGGITTDAGFRVYIANTGFSPSGNLTSGSKDANPAPGLTPIWTTLSWNATTPANTSLKFQIAGSNNVNGPFTFAGPDGTPATFFTTSPASLTRFQGLRYLGYKAYLSTTDSTVTPALNDVTICFSDVDCSGVVVLPTPTPAQVCANSTGNSASGPDGMTAYSWSIVNGTITSSTTTQSITYTAGASGNVLLFLSVTAPNTCVVSNSVLVPVNPLPATPTISGTLVFCTGGNTTLTSSSATGNQWYLGGNPIGGATGQQYVATASGSYTVQVTGGNGCVSAMSAATVVTVNSPPPTPTINGTTNGTGSNNQACPEQPLTLTATSAGATSFQWYKDNSLLSGETNSTTIATSAGSFTVTATSSGCPTSAQSAAYVVTNPKPNKPFITAGGPTTFCAGGSVTLSSNSATGIQWYLGGNPISGATQQNYVATASGSYTAILNALGCHSATSDPTVVTVNPLPAIPTITPGGAMTFCAGGSVALTSSAVSGNQWYLNGNPIGGATNQVYSATASGNYTVKTTDGNNCTSAASSATVVTVNPIPASPAISGANSFCTGGSTTLTSSSASGNQWFLNGNPIGGATNQTYVATAAGSYTVTVTASGCTSAPSAARAVSVNPKPNATITAPASAVTGSTGNVASVANAGVGATYSWGITGGTITAGTGTNSITFTAGAVGTLTLDVTVTTSAGCSDAKSANVNVIVPPVTVTSASPAGGTIAGGSAVTINGTGFLSGASVTFGGAAATNVVVVSSVKITARTPAHALGAVNVTVTNLNTTTGTRTNGYLYKAQQFDPNNDGTVTSTDIFYLVNFIFLGGPPPSGASGMLSGDANGDGIVNSADIFFLVNYLFLSGPRPNAAPTLPRVTTSTEGTASPEIAGSIALGKPVLRSGRYVVPVVMTTRPGSIVPQAMSLRIHFDSEALMGEATVRRAGVAKDLATPFEITRRSGNDLSYLVSYGGLALGESRSAVVAEIEIEIDSVDGAVAISVDPRLTMLGDQAGLMSATVGNGRLEVSGTAIRSVQPRPHTPENEVN